jgi:NitT/TauT family transport system substrate-binding protein
MYSPLSPKEDQMIIRRDFCLGVATVCLAGASDAGLAQGRRIFRAANPNAVLDAQQAFATCGRHPRLGYYEMEGVDLEYVNMNSIVQAMLSVATGEADTASLAPALFLPALAKAPSLGIVAAYNWLPRNANVVVVKPESPIKSVSDLVGKRIGIRNQGDGGIVQLKLMYRELGLAASDIDFIAVGDSGTAGTALSQDKVDAIVTFDTAAGRIQAVGFPLRYLPLPPAYSRLGSGWFGFRNKDLKEDRKNVAGFCRAVAKSTLFAHANLAQALSIHWALYPDSKSKSKSDDESRKEIEIIMDQRRNNWIRRPDDPDQRWGASSLQEWKAMVAIAAESSNNPLLSEQIGDLSHVFTNDLIDEINDFDKDAIVRQAKDFRL